MFFDVNIDRFQLRVYVKHRNVFWINPIRMTNHFKRLV